MSPSKQNVDFFSVSCTFFGFFFRNTGPGGVGSFEDTQFEGHVGSGSEMTRKPPGNWQQWQVHTAHSTINVAWIPETRAGLSVRPNLAIEHAASQWRKHSLPYFFLLSPDI
jgi:hypothetical protein